MRWLLSLVAMGAFINLVLMDDSPLPINYRIVVGTLTMMLIIVRYYFTHQDHRSPPPGEAAQVNPSRPPRRPRPARKRHQALPPTGTNRI